MMNKQKQKGYSFLGGEDSYDSGTIYGARYRDPKHAKNRGWPQFGNVDLSIEEVLVLATEWEKEKGPIPGLLFLVTPSLPLEHEKRLKKYPFISLIVKPPVYHSRHLQSLDAFLASQQQINYPQTPVPVPSNLVADIVAEAVFQLAQKLEKQKKMKDKGYYEDFYEQALMQTYKQFQSLSEKQRTKYIQDAIKNAGYEDDENENYYDYKPIKKIEKLFIKYFTDNLKLYRFDQQKTFYTLEEIIEKAKKQKRGNSSGILVWKDGHITLGNREITKKYPYIKIYSQDGLESTMWPDRTRYTKKQKQQLRKEAQIWFGKNYNKILRNVDIIEAERGAGFQEYVFSQGGKVPPGAPVGYENKKGDLTLFLDILYSDKPDPQMSGKSLLTATPKKNVKSILQKGFQKQFMNDNITQGIYTVDFIDSTEEWYNIINPKNDQAYFVLVLQPDAKIFFTGTHRPIDMIFGAGNAEYKKLYKQISKGLDIAAIPPNWKNRKTFARRLESWLDKNGYCGIEQGGETVITDFSCIKRKIGPLYTIPELLDVKVQRVKNEADFAKTQQGNRVTVSDSLAHRIVYQQLHPITVLEDVQKQNSVYSLQKGRVNRTGKLVYRVKLTSGIWSDYFEDSEWGSLAEARKIIKEMIPDYRKFVKDMKQGSKNWQQKGKKQ
jgi:hypothetical protein